MDQRERLNDPVEAFRTGVEGHLIEVWTALPGIIQDFDPQECTCSVQPSLQARRLLSSGSYVWENLPLLTHVPVVFPHSKNFILTFPVEKGDEALIIFSSRCINLWWNLGGIQKEEQLRAHNIDDGFVLIGPYSRPQVPASISTDSVQLRNADASAYIELAAGGVVNISAPGGFNIKGATTGDREGVFNGHTVGAHTHIDPQGGVTGPPTG